VEIGLFYSDPALFDSDGDGLDDASELLINASCAGDINIDGMISVTDLMLMLGVFGLPCAE
jgi:hypothetical protein